jgi:hypothetical protein
MSFERGLGFTLLVSLAAGCAKHATPVVPPDAAAIDLAADSLPDGSGDAMAAAGARPTLIVAGERGVREIAINGSEAGSEVRTITRSPGHHPRWVAARALVMLEYRGHGTSVSGLRRVDLDSGRSERVARVLEFRCHENESGERRVLSLQSADDFRISGDSRFAYLQLTYRAFHGSDVVLNMRIELRNGRANLYMPEGKEECPLPGLGNEFPYVPRKRAAQPKRDDNISLPGLPGFELESRGLSPSGNWALLSGNEESAESTIYRTVVLLDRRDGQLYPIRTGAWPGALGPAELPRLARGAEPDMLVIANESDVRWIRLGDDDGLIIDQTLFRPGHASVDLGGDLVE